MLPYIDPSTSPVPRHESVINPWVEIHRFTLRGWIQFRPSEGERLQKVSNLIALFNLGHMVGQLRCVMAPRVTPGSKPFFQICGVLQVELNHMLDGEPLPFQSTVSTTHRPKAVIDKIYEECRDDGAKFDEPLAPIHARELKIGMDGLELHLKEELDALPIWLVTPRRAYSVDILINRAEDVLQSSDVELLSAKTILDLRQAGRYIAFDVPTAAGFHSVRAVEAVARGYQEIITGNAANPNQPLGPVINILRTERDARIAARTIDKEDLLNLAIDMLTRVNNVYRKPLTHPDMVLELSGALRVFDSSKCAIELILEDAKKKSPSPITVGFF